VAAMKALMAAEGTTHERRRRSHLVKFVAVVTERGGDVNAPSLADVCAFLFDFFERNGSANSLDKVLSFLRSGYARAGLPWLSYAEAETLKRIMKIWKEEHGKEVEQGVPITSRVLARWLRALPHTTADPTLLTAILRVGHAGLLRAGELCRRERQSDPGYQVSDVRWAPDYRSFELHIGITKCNREQGGDTILIADQAAVRAMYDYFLRASLFDSPTKPLYPPQVTTRWIRERIRELAAACGEDPRCYSTHGLRAGAATDLVDGGVSYPHLKKAGRWNSDACLIYFRSGVSVARAVARLLSDARARTHKPQEGQVSRHSNTAPQSGRKTATQARRVKIA